MATLLLSEDFTGGRLTSSQLEFFTGMPELYAADGQPYYVACPGKAAAHYYAKEGTNEKIPFEIIFNSGQLSTVGYTDSFTEFCFQWQEFFATGYGFPDSGQKMFRMFYDDSNFPSSKKSTELATLNSNTDLQYAAYIDQTDAFVQNSDKPHPINEWVTWRVWLKLNDQGTTNGFIRVYMNGNPFLGGENLKLRDDADPYGYNSWWVGGNYSMQGGIGGLPSDGHRYVTGIRWWDTSPD